MYLVDLGFQVLTIVAMKIFTSKKIMFFSMRIFVNFLLMNCIEHISK